MTTVFYYFFRRTSIFLSSYLPSYAWDGMKRWGFFNCLVWMICYPLSSIKKNIPFDNCSMISYGHRPWLCETFTIIKYNWNKNPHPFCTPKVGLGGEPYSYKYEVSDQGAKSGPLRFTKQEKFSASGDTTGQYSVLLPDGRTQVRK